VLVTAKGDVKYIPTPRFMADLAINPTGAAQEAAVPPASSETRNFGPSDANTPSVKQGTDTGTPVGNNGLGFSLNLPKFNFADLNVYVRNDTNQSGVTYQITPVWQVPFSVGKADFVFEGFSDIAGPEGDLSFNIDFQPRLLLDLGKVWDKPGNLYFGTELMIWHNKFGFKGVNEFAPQAMLKWVL